MRGVVRVSASEVVGIEVLPPVLAQLRRTHPELVVELVATNRVQDLLQREADIAVRMTQPQQEMLIARRIGETEVGLHARADYLDANGTPRTLADLPQFALIGYDTVTPFVREATRKWPFWKREAFALRTDSDVAQFAMIRAGCGIGACQVGIARRDASLVRVLPRAFAIRLPVWITMHEDLRGNRRCKAVFDALASGLDAYLASARA